MRLRLIAVVAATVFAATAFVTVPLVTPAAAHGGGCTAYARAPKIVAPRTMEVFGSFSCPSSHQTISISVEIQARARGHETWERYHVESARRSGGTSIGLDYDIAYWCEVDFRTVVKGLAGSSGSVTHSQSATSGVFKSRCG